MKPTLIWVMVYAAIASFSAYLLIKGSPLNEVLMIALVSSVVVGASVGVGLRNRRRSNRQ